MNPEARKDGLVVQAVADELIIYDLNRHRVHHLNRTAALVWQICDGVTTVSEMADSLHARDAANGEAPVVELAIEELRRANLLQPHPTPKPETSSLSRRQLLRRAAMAAGLTIALPAITSMVAPMPAHAQDPAGGKDVCTGPFFLNKPVSFSGRGKDGVEAIKKANEAVKAFGEDKCKARSCGKKDVKCGYFGIHNGTGSSKDDEKTKEIIFTWTVTAYSCKCN